MGWDVELLEEELELDELDLDFELELELLLDELELELLELELLEPALDVLGGFLTVYKLVKSSLILITFNETCDTYLTTSITQ